MELFRSFLEIITTGGPVLFIAGRLLAIVIPPIPGFAIDLAGVAAFGALRSFVLAEIGVLTGAALTFSIARFFREPAIRQFTSLKKVHDWETQLSQRRKFWAFTLFRMPTIPFFDYISYAAGLTTLSFRQFIGGTFLGHLPYAFVTFYLGGIALERGIWLFVAFVAGALLVAFIVSRKRVVQWMQGFLQ